MSCLTLGRIRTRERRLREQEVEKFGGEALTTLVKLMEDRLAANLATSLLVASVSPLGLPVSTTHVSTGGIFGIGASSGKLRWRMAGEVVLAWIVTLPLAAALGGVMMWSLR